MIPVSYKSYGTGQRAVLVTPPAGLCSDRIHPTSLISCLWSASLAACTSIINLLSVVVVHLVMVLNRLSESVSTARESSVFIMRVRSWRNR